MCIFIFSTKTNNSHATWTIHIVIPESSTKFPDFPGQWEPWYSKEAMGGSKTVSLVIWQSSQCSLLLITQLVVMSHGFVATATYWSKSRLWDLPCLI